MSEQNSPIAIKLSDVVAMINAGKTRDEIGAHYGLNKANQARLFQDESLKGIKTRKTSTFTIEHDVETSIDKKNKKAANKAEATDTASSDGTTPDQHANVAAPAPKGEAIKATPAPAQATVSLDQENW